MTRADTIARIVACLLIVGEVALFVTLHRRITAPEFDERSVGEPIASAVPDLARQRYLMQLAERAIRDGDGRTAIDALSSADFGTRPVEIYRRYYLANAQELLGKRAEARATLSTLWEESPIFARRMDVAFRLAELYREEGDWGASADILETLCGDPSPEVANAAYQRLLPVLMASGSVERLAGTSRRIAVARAGSPAGATAEEMLEALDVRLTRRERIERIRVLARKGDPADALDEIKTLKTAGTSIRVEQARAMAIARQGKRDEADRIVLAMSGSNRALDREFLADSWEWWLDEVDEIDARRWRDIRVRRRTGTTRVKVKGRWVNRPVYSTVTRRVKHSLGKTDRRRLADVNRILVARGESLLGMEIDATLQAEIHRRLAHVEETPRRQEKLEEHVRKLVELEPLSDEMLQLLWDEGWAAWKKRDLDTARERFAFIYRVYQATAIRRQARYWYARCLEESGETAEAQRHFRELQDAPYDDVYALLARERTNGSVERTAVVPFSERTDDWVAIAEREMPDELRLAWELSLLGLNHDARVEVRLNTTPQNRTWAYSILARIHRAEDSPLLVSHTLRVAYPEISTVELDRVPVHFLKMYYPTRYHDVVETHATKHSLDDALVKALILQESAYDPGARSGAGATGLMQLMSPTAREIAPRVNLNWYESQLIEPEYNVQIGTRYLRTLMAEFNGNPMLALAAYNGGIGNVKKWLRKELKGVPPDEIIESIPFRETRGYVKRIILYRSVYDRAGTSHH